VAERARLLDLHLTASEDRALIRSELGEHATAAAHLAPLVHQHPLRERLWALWALTLARAGRQGDALAALRQVREALVDELGVDPHDSVRAVEPAVLAQDARVLRPAERTPAERTSAPRTPAARTPAAPAPTGRPYDIDDRTIGPPAEDPQRWPLVDRDSELDRLTALLGQVADGRTRFAVLVGEPGIGKSRLIAELAGRARAAGLGVSVGRCSADDGAPPLWPWLAVLRELSTRPDAEAVTDLSDVDRQVLNDLAPAAVPVRPGVASIPAPSTVESARFQIAEAVRRLLVAVAAGRPLLLVLEDLHWGDRSSLRLLHHLTESLVDARLLVLVSRRAHPEPSGVLADVSEALARRHALRLGLTGLSADGVSRLVTAVTGQPATADVVTALRTRTNGNPFFLVELVRLLGDAPPDAPDPAPIPAAVSDVVSARVARLPEPTREVLRTAAVLGREWGVADLAAALDQPVVGVLDALEPALDSGIVAEDARVGWFRFSHALVRDVLYHGQPVTRRPWRHAAAAAALGQRGPDRLSETARPWRPRMVHCGRSGVPASYTNRPYPPCAGRCAGCRRATATCGAGCCSRSAASFTMRARPASGTPWPKRDWSCSSRILSLVDNPTVPVPTGLRLDHHCRRHQQVSSQRPTTATAIAGATAVVLECTPTSHRTARPASW
jgi:hypothetical protein